jgi:hypothetical protein
MSFSDAQFEKAAAGAGYRIAQRQSQLEYMSGMAESRATAMGTWGALASGIGQLGSLGMTAAGRSSSRTTPATTARS